MDLAQVLTRRRLTLSRRPSHERKRKARLQKVLCCAVKLFRLRRSFVAEVSRRRYVMCVTSIKSSARLCVSISTWRNLTLESSCH